MASTDYLNWVPSEAGALTGNETLSGDPAMLTEPVVAATSPPADYASAPRQSLAELVTNHLTAARRSYMENGWRRLQTGDYLGALRMFSLAENASLDSLNHRADAILAKVYAGIAAGQFAQAANSLEWLVRDASQFGRQGHPEAFNRIFDDNHASTMADLYVGPEGVSRTAEYERGNLAVESLAAKNPNLAAARALLAVVEWGRGRRANAIFEAKKITGPGERLSALASVLEEADRLRQWRPGADERGLAGEPGLASPSTQPVQ